MYNVKHFNAIVILLLFSLFSNGQQTIHPKNDINRNITNKFLLTHFTGLQKIENETIEIYERTDILDHGSFLIFNLQEKKVAYTIHIMDEEPKEFDVQSVIIDSNGNEVTLLADGLGIYLTKTGKLQETQIAIWTILITNPEVPDLIVELTGFLYDKVI